MKGGIIITKNNISKKMNLTISTHSQIEFVDIITNNDTKLFLDPCLISIGKDKWSLMAQETLDSFFNKFYSLYRNKSDNAAKLNLFSHLHEINPAKLGYGKGNNGKAKTPEGTLNTFSQIDNLFSKFIILNEPIDLPLFIKDFSYDCLSDMELNILFKVLSDFTLEICQKYNVPTTKIKKKFYYWDTYTSDWKLYEGMCLTIENEIFLLVPKWFVRNRFYYNTNQYFSKIILEKLQEERADSIGKPSKKSLKEDLIHGNHDVLLVSIEHTQKDTNLLDKYHKLIPQLYSNKQMSDEALDKILYLDS